MILAPQAKLGISLSAAVCLVFLQRGRHHEEEHRRVEEMDDQQQPAPPWVSGKRVRSSFWDNTGVCALVWRTQLTRQQGNGVCFFGR